MGKAPFLERFANGLYGSYSRISAGHGVADGNAFESHRGDRVLLLPRASFPTSGERGVRIVLCVSCLPCCAPYACCRCDSGFQTLTADCCVLLEKQQRIRSGLLPRAGDTPATGGGLNLRRGLIFDQAVTSQKFR